MPLTKKGMKIKAAMKKEYGPKKGERVFYASSNKGTVKGVHRMSDGHMMKDSDMPKSMPPRQFVPDTPRRSRATRKRRK